MSRIDKTASSAAQPGTGLAQQGLARLLQIGPKDMQGLAQPAVIRHLILAAGALLALCVIGFIAIGALVLSRDYADVANRFSAMTSRKTGATVTIGAAEIRYWPLPRVVLHQLDVEVPQANFSLTAKRAVLRFRLVDMLDGVINSPDLELTNPDIRLSFEELASYVASPRGVTDLLDAAAASFTGLDDLSGMRLSIRSGRITIAGVSGPEAAILDPVDMQFRYRAHSGRIDINARRATALRPLEFTASLPTLQALQKRDNQPASATISGIGSRARFEGRMSRSPDLAVSGRIEGSFREDFERLIGVSISRGHPNSVDDETRVAGFMTLDPRGGGLQGVTVTRGSASLSGIAAMRENAGRWSVSATLAGDLVDGTATYQALQKLRHADGTWSRQSLDVNPTPGLDLDIRLSTKQFRLGKVTLDDAALSIFTRRGRAEFAIADSRFAGGSLKARVALAQSQRGQDVRLQISGDRLESETLFEQAFGFSRLRGLGSFVLHAETNGSSVAEFASNLTGTGNVDIKAGQISGFDANRLMSRLADFRPEAAILAALGGRTAFEAISAHLIIREGRIEPGGSNLVAPRMFGLLDGWIDLAQQRHDMSIVLRRREEQPALPSDFFAFRIEGPLFAPTLRPDPSLLARRS
ncbi:AsmA [Rhabdaerophilaceae bacterium]